MERMTGQERLDALRRAQWAEVLNFCHTDDFTAGGAYERGVVERAIAKADEEIDYAEFCIRDDY